MSKLLYRNPETNKLLKADGKYDLDTQEDTNVTKLGYVRMHELVDPNTNKKVRVTDKLLKGSLDRGYILSEQHKANDSKPDTAQIAKHGSVGRGESYIRGLVQTVPIADELKGFGANPMGGIKSAASYLGITDDDENDKDVNEYKAARDLARARNDAGAEIHPIDYYAGQAAGTIATLGVGGPLVAASKLGKMGLAALEGGALAMGASSGKTINDDAGNIALGAGAGGVLQGAAEGVKAVGGKIKSYLGKHGDGLGKHYIDNPTALKDDLGASERSHDVQVGINERAVDVDRLTQKRHLNKEIESAQQGSRLYDEAGKDTLDEFSQTQRIPNDEIADRVKEIQSGTQERKLSKDRLDQKTHLNKEINSAEQGSSLFDAAGKDTLNEFSQAQRIPNDEISGRVKEIQDRIKERTINADRLAHKAKIDNDISSSTEAAHLYEEAAEAALVEFKLTQSAESKQMLGALIKKHGDQIKDLGNKRDVRFDELDDEAATDQLKQAYTTLKNNLMTQVGGTRSKPAIKEIVELERFLPEDGMNHISQGQLLKRMRDAIDVMNNRSKWGEGYSSLNFDKKEIASQINRAFHESGDKVVSDLTHGLSTSLSKRNILRKNAAKRADTLNEKDHMVSLFDPDPKKAEGVSDITKDGLKTAGYDPQMTEAIAQKTKEIDQRRRVLLNEIEQLKSQRAQAKHEYIGSAASDKRDIASMKSNMVPDDVINKSIAQRQSEIATQGQTLKDEITRLKSQRETTKQQFIDSNNADRRAIAVEQRNIVPDDVIDKSISQRQSEIATQGQTLKDEVSNLQSQRDSATQKFDMANEADRRVILRNNQGTYRIKKLEGEPNLADMAVETAADSMMGPVGRIARHTVNKLGAVNQIKAYNYVKERFNKPALTAAVRVLTLSGRAITRLTINALAQQHGVDAAELARVMEQPQTK